MKTKHTTGPWQMCNGGPSEFYIKSPQESELICSLEKSEKEKPNALLIAAAPELLMALEYAEDQLRMVYHFAPHVLIKEAIRQAQEAIAKAEGEGL